MVRRVTVLMLSLLVVAFVAGCSTRPDVRRLKKGQEIDLTGRWNANDARRVAEEMITDALEENNGWLKRFREETGNRPRVIVGFIENKTSEHLNTESFIRDFERELINSGQVSFVAAADQRKAIRAERRDQAQHATEETAAEFRQELAADFMLQGEVLSNQQRAGGERVREYQVSLELLNIETNEKVWIGDKKIQKYVERAGVAW